jgi:hypothetical protein
MMISINSINLVFQFQGQENSQTPQQVDHMPISLLQYFKGNFFFDKVSK